MTRRTATRLTLITAAMLALTGCVDDAYETEQAAWIAAGHPTDPQAMLPEPVPDERNAATYYLEASRLIEALPPADLNLLQNSTSSHSLLRVAPKLEPILHVAERGWACDACVWPVDRSDGTDFGLYKENYPKAMRNVARMYHALALAAEAKGEREQAMRLIERGLEAANDLSSDPFAIATLTQLAIVSLLLDGYRDNFAEGELPENRVLSLLEKIDVAAAFRRDAVLQTAIYINAYEAGALDRLFDGHAEESGLREELAWLMSGTRQVLAGAMTVQEATSRAKLESDVLLEQVPQPWGVLSHLGRWQARLDVQRLGVELREYKAEHGEYPETFDTPVNPLTGEPFVYEKTRTGCVVASRYEAKQPIEWRWE